MIYLKKGYTISKDLRNKSNKGLVRPYQPDQLPGLIISGGESGADMGGLIGADKLNIPTIGFTTYNYTSENVSKKWLKYFGLYPIPDYISTIKKGIRSEGFSSRDQLNVDLSDGVFAIRTTVAGRGKGTFQTYNYANKYEYWPNTMDEQVQKDFWAKSKTITKVNQKGYTIQINAPIHTIKSSKPIFILWIDPIIFRYTSIPVISKKLHNFIVKNKVHRLLISGPKEESYSRASRGKSIQNLVIRIIKTALLDK
jgi:hypothetical protein